MALEKFKSRWGRGKEQRKLTSKLREKAQSNKNKHKTGSNYTSWWNRNKIMLWTVYQTNFKAWLILWGKNAQIGTTRNKTLN